MEYKELLSQWSSLVRDFKDMEKEYDIEPRDSELLALDILNHIRWSRIRQWNLFIQFRGEEFEAFIEKLREKGYQEDAVRRFLEDEELWKATLLMAEY
jgi:hypothetical protein